MIRVILGLNRQTIFSISLRPPRLCVKKTGALKRRDAESAKEADLFKKLKCYGIVTTQAARERLKKKQEKS